MAVTTRHLWAAIARTGLAGLAACMALLGKPSLGQPAATGAPALVPVPASAFFRPPVMARPVLSPNGQKLAVHVSAPDGRRRLAVLDVANPRNAKIVAGLCRC